MTPPPSRARTGTPTKHGFYSHNFTPEEIAKLDTISTEQFLADIKGKMLMILADLLRRPELSARERLSVLKLIRRINR